MTLYVLEQLVFRHGTRTVLDIDRLELAAGCIHALIGHNGAGKTSLLMLLAFLTPPSHGRILYQGRMVEASERDRRRLRQDVVLVPQHPVMFTATVASNIEFGLKLRGVGRSARASKVDEVLEMVGLRQYRNAAAHELSGGETQRVALARALAPRPRLVLLDEPFASLDRPATEELRRNLRHILHHLEVPAVLVTHNPVDALALGDRMVLMDGGRVLRQGLPAAILAEAGGLPAETFGSVARARVVGRVEGLLRLQAGPAELYAPDPGGDLAEVHACVRGEGVSLERGAHGRMTQRNRLPARILRLEEAGALVRVHLDAGFPLHALITAWAARDMELREGDQVQALIKASAIQVIPIQG